MTKPKLAPCPFCGSRDLKIMEPGDWPFVTCLSCYADGPHLSLPDVSAAIAAWNTRAKEK